MSDSKSIRSINLEFYQKVMEEDHKYVKEIQEEGSPILEEEIRASSIVDRIIEPQADKSEIGEKVEACEQIEKNKNWFYTVDMQITQTVAEGMASNIAHKKDKKFMKILSAFAKQKCTNKEECDNSEDSIRASLRRVMENMKSKGKRVNIILIHRNAFQNINLEGMIPECKIEKHSFSDADGIDMIHKIFIFGRESGEMNWAINRTNETILYIGRGDPNFYDVSFKGYQLSYIQIHDPKAIAVIEIENQ